MAGIRTLLSIVNGASSNIRNINTDMNTLINTARRLNRHGSDLIRTSVIDRANDGVNRVRNSLNTLRTEMSEIIRRQREHNDGVKNTDRNTNNLVNTMRRLLGVYIGISGLKKILSVSDDLSQTHSRINLMNDGLQTTAELKEKIMKSANRSRAAYSDTAKVISKLGITASKSFKNNDEIIAFTELMNKSFKLGGASASEQANGMYQLTQAMASGKLQGDEFRSIIENAPLLAKAIAEYTGVGQQGLKKMSSEGLITADIIKGALFSSANEIEERYKQMPITFSDIWNRIKNGSIAAFRPFLNKFSEIANSDKFSSAISGLINLLVLLGMVLANVINIAVSGASFIYDNWSIIEPIFWAIIAVIGLYTSVTIAQSIATSALAFAQWALNSAILSCPLFWIIAGILAVIVIIAVLIHKTIGFKLAWLQTVNFIIVVWDSLVIAGHMMANGVCDAWDNILIGIKMVSTGIINAISIMKSTGLMILQDFINGAIDLINKLINSVNKVVDTGIGTINHVTFGTEAVIKTRYENAKRDEELNSYISEKRNNMQRRADKIKRMEKEAHLRELLRKSDMEKARIEHENSKNKNIIDFSPSGFDYNSFANNDALKNIQDNTKGTKDHTGKIKDTLDISEEDLKYLRDIAQKEVIDRTVLRDVNVKIDNSFGDINQTADVDGIIRKIEQRIDEEIAISAEGA
ncbi:MAG: tape measure protein [Peptoanaerobacter stomatis]|uniref:tape measure protein n=1 Tax=Peptoanaerobacter stomatis TaxID=796937 RepID=UPI003FA1950B